MRELLRDLWRVIAGNRRETAQRPGLEAQTDAAFNEALTAHQADRLQEAQAMYRRILDRTPDHAATLHFLGVSYFQTGDLVQAEHLIRQALKIQEAPEYFSNLALVLDRQGKFSEAETVYRQAIKLDPDNVTICRNLGDMLVRASRHADAEPVFLRAIELQPDDAEIHFKLADVLTALDRAVDAVGAYHHALRIRPDYPQASNNLGNALKQMRRYAEAEQAYRKTLLLQPDAAPVYCNLGQLLQEIGRHADAESALRRAVELQPELAFAQMVLGNSLAATGRHVEAQAAFRRALELQPDNPDVHNNLGNVLKAAGHYSEAEAAYRQALKLNPAHVDAWGNLGMLLQEAGQFDAAEAAVRKALTLSPGSAMAHNNLGNLYRKTNRLKEAEAAYRQALLLDADCAQACGNLAVLLQERGKIAEAESLHKKAVALKPDSVEALINYGGFLLEARRYAASEEVYQRALALQPGSAEAQYGLGNVYKESQRYGEAEAAYRRALELQPTLVGAYGNLGFLLQWSERYEEAEAAFRKELEFNPDSDLAQYNYGLFCLSQQRFDEGWNGYERRWNIKEFNSVPRLFPQPRWQGEIVPGETLLVWQEQGVGDAVLYAGMISDLVTQGMVLVVECERRLVPLFARSFPQVSVVERSSPPHPATRLARWHSPMGSLCRWLRIWQGEFARQRQYLVADASRVERNRKRYRALGNGPVVGVSWRSSNEKMGQSKSLSLSEWPSLLALPDTTFVNLQYGDCDEELSRLKRDAGITIHHDATIDSLKDLDGFAAQVAAMDLVISTSNSTVHFAGALGVPVWTLLPRGGPGLLWYWFNRGEESPWYPSMKLFRQDSPGDWSGVLDRVARNCNGFVQSSR